MKTTLGICKAIALTAGLAIAMNAHAQTRHDEKPHGPPKKAVKKSDVKQPRGGTRHDEKPHGPPAKSESGKK